MPLIYTIPTYITLGQATTFLMANEQAKGVLWPTLLQPSSPVLVAIVTDALLWEWERLLAAINLAEPNAIGINNTYSLLINPTFKLLV